MPGRRRREIELVTAEQRPMWLAEQVDQLDDKVGDRQDSFDDRLEKVQARLTGILVAVSTSAILLAINVLLGAVSNAP